PLQEAPEILQAIGMDLPAHVLPRVVDRFVLVELGQLALAVLAGGISVEVCALLDGRDDVSVQAPLAHVLHDDGAHTTGLAVAPALQDAEHRSLVHAAGSANNPVALGPMH